MNAPTGSAPAVPKPKRGGRRHGAPPPRLASSPSSARGWCPISHLCQGPGLEGAGNFPCSLGDAELPALPPPSTPVSARDRTQGLVLANKHVLLHWATPQPWTCSLALSSWTLPLLGGDDWEEAEGLLSSGCICGKSCRFKLENIRNVLLLIGQKLGPARVLMRVS